MTTTTNDSTREQNYHRAWKASHEIQALDTMVRLIALLGPPDEEDEWDVPRLPLGVGAQAAGHPHRRVGTWQRSGAGHRPRLPASRESRF